MFLSIIFNAPAQTTSVISHLIPTLYQAVSEPTKRRTETVLLSLLHFLVAGYPSQSRYFEHLHSLPNSFLTLNHPARRWVQDLTQTLRFRNYARLDENTSREACSRLFPVPNPPTCPVDSPHTDLTLQALHTLADALRAKARETHWTIVRTAYRELSLPRSSEAEPALTRDWLCRTLTLRSIGSGGAEDVVHLVDTWIASKAKQGDVKQKEGLEERWIVTKPKT